MVTLCGHVFCGGCMALVAKAADKSCPLCREDVNDDDFVPFVRVQEEIKKLGVKPAKRDQEDIVAEPLPATKGTWVSSTKINQLMTNLGEVMSIPDGEKVIVFSQFTTMLDLVEQPLNLAGYPFVRYDGQMSLNAREDSLMTFRTDPNTRILLMSLKCGGLGLNLTVASRVFLLDIWWNPVSSYYYFLHFRWLTVVVVVVFFSFSFLFF